MIPARKRLIKRQNCYKSRRSHNGLLNGGQDGANSRLMLVRERLQRQPRIPPAIPALVHNELDPRDTELRDDLVGGPQQHLLQLAGLFHLPLVKELIKRRAFFRKRARQSQNGPARTHRKARKYCSRSAYQHLKLRRRTRDHLGNTLNISRAVLYTDNVLMFGERDSLRGFERPSRKNRDGINEDRYRRLIGNASVMGDELLRFISRLVVIRSFYERRVVSHSSRPLRSFNGFRGGFRAAAREEFFSSRGRLLHRVKYAVHFLGPQQDRFTRGAEHYISCERGLVVAANVVLHTLERHRAIRRERCR